MAKKEALTQSANSLSRQRRRLMEGRADDPGTFAELDRLARAIEEGRLTERARLEAAAPAERPAIAAINRIVEALTAPLAGGCRLHDQVKQRRHSAQNH